ncbi:MAG TPA: ATP-binding protein [Tepidisphaeraceae bacterium]|nr:ATP-binding protein [Tepidisphaeraceae bacterium]
MTRWTYRILTALIVGALVCSAACAAAFALAAKIGPWLAALAAGGSAAALLVLIWFVLTRHHWTAPLKTMTDQATRIAQSGWAGQVALVGSTEIRRLFEQFNQAASLTHRQFQRLQHEQADLQALVDTMPDPILASDHQNRLILMNSPAARLLRLSTGEALGQKVVNIISDAPVVELFEAVALNGDAHGQVQREVRFSRGGQRLTCQAVAARTAGGGTLVVLRDVSELARAMQMKTDFVANASHELRTPITAIKIAFETLSDAVADDPEQAEKCMAVIAGHLQRLEDMLRDLLDLSRLEGPEIEPAMTAVKIADLFNTVRGALLPMARQKPVELLFNEPNPEALYSDARLLNLILKNLVENSIKYTPPGGTVSVSLTSLGGERAMLTVADTGIGIAPEHIDRVFERFYQVDSARSGSAGRGTGLGLAIVKHAVLAMGGTVKLESTVGQGTSVMCSFPQHALPKTPAAQTPVEAAV